MNPYMDSDDTCRLPEPWQKCLSRSQNIVYYFNPNSNERYWAQTKSSDGQICDVPFPWGWYLNRNGEKQYINLLTGKHSSNIHSTNSKRHKPNIQPKYQDNSSCLIQVEIRDTQSNLCITADNHQLMVSHDTNEQLQLRTTCRTKDQFSIQVNHKTIFPKATNAEKTFLPLIWELQQYKNGWRIGYQYDKHLVTMGLSTSTETNISNRKIIWPSTTAICVRFEFRTLSLCDNSSLQSNTIWNILGLQISSKQEIAKGFRAQIFTVNTDRTIFHDSVVAMKVQPLRELSDTECKASMAICSKKHSYIAPVIGWVRDSLSDYIIMPYFKVDLWSWLQSKRFLRSETVETRWYSLYHVFEQVLQALEHVHLSGYLYMDLHPKNILLDTETDASKEGIHNITAPHIRLTDFGSCVPLQNGRYNGPTQGGRWDLMAPEQFSKIINADVTLDVFAAGSFFYLLLYGQAPFSPGEGHKLRRNNTLFHPHRNTHRNELRENLRTVTPKTLFATIDLIMKALETDPAARPHSVSAFRRQLQQLSVQC